MEGPVQAGRDRVEALGPLLGQAAQDQGPEARGLAAHRHRTDRRLPRQLEDLGPGPPGPAQPEEHLDAVPKALSPISRWRPWRAGSALASAVRVGLQGDAVVGGAHADLVRSPAVKLESLGAPASLELELE